MLSMVEVLACQDSIPELPSQPDFRECKYSGSTCLTNDAKTGIRTIQIVYKEDELKS